MALALTRKFGEDFYVGCERFIVTTILDGIADGRIFVDWDDLEAQLNERNSERARRNRHEFRLAGC